MTGDGPKPDPRVISSYLDEVDLELDAVSRLIEEPPNRLAAFHLSALEPLSAYATTYRCPTPGGKRKPGSSSADILAWRKTIGDLASEFRATRGR